MRCIDDWDAGSFLKNIAMLEIRAMARRGKPVEIWPDDNYVACIAWLADLCHNMPDASIRASGLRGIIQFRKNRERPSLHVWRVADLRGKEWIIDRLKREGISWTPPSCDVKTVPALAAAGQFSERLILRCLFHLARQLS